MTIYYVARAGGDNTNPGTEALPWQSINKAAWTAIAGDTVYVQEGIYNERLIPQNSGTPGNWITFSAAPGTAKDSVIIDGTGIICPYLEGLVYINGKSHIKVSGFRIQYAKGTVNKSGSGISVRGLMIPFSYITLENNHIYDTMNSGIEVCGAGHHITINKNELEYGQNAPHPMWENEGLSVGSETGGVDNVVISNNHVHHDALWMNNTDSINKNRTDYGGAFITLKDGTTNAWVFGNEVDHIGSWWDWSAGIYLGAYTGILNTINVYNNYIHDIPGVGIEVTYEQGAPFPSRSVQDIKIFNNLIFNGDLAPGRSKMGMRIAPPHTPAEGIVKNILIINNTIYGLQYGIMAGASLLSSNIRVRNNLVVDNTVQQMYCYEARVAIDHNLVFGIAPGNIGTFPVLTDPRLVHPLLNDFHLQSTSPAIGAGSITEAPTLDFEGKVRNMPPSIGAFEYGSIPVCIPSWQCDVPFNGYEDDGCGNRQLNAACNPPETASIPSALIWGIGIAALYTLYKFSTKR